MPPKMVLFVPCSGLPCPNPLGPLLCGTVCDVPWGSLEVLSPLFCGTVCDVTRGCLEVLDPELKPRKTRLVSTDPLLAWPNR
jgi:hypothetical protein